MLWGYESSRIGADIQYTTRIYGLHKDLYNRNILVDFIPPDRDVAGYKLVILPSLMMIDADFARRLKCYVASGGAVLAAGQIGLRDFNDNYLPAPGPQYLEDLLGVLIEGGTYLRSHVEPNEAMSIPASKTGILEVPVAGAVGGEFVTGSARCWIADLTLNGGTALLEFTGDIYKGQPAIVEKRTGDGCTIYLGTVSLSDELMQKGLDYVLSVAKIKPGPETSEHVEVVRRGDVTFVINHVNWPTSVPLGNRGKAIVGRYEAGEAKLEAYGVCVVRGAGQ